MGLVKNCNLLWTVAAVLINLQHHAYAMNFMESSGSGSGNIPVQSTDTNGDRTVEFDDINLEVLGQSGKIRISNANAGKGVTITFDGIKELDANKTIIPSHTFNTFANQNFNMSSLKDCVFNTSTAESKCFKFSTTLSSNNAVLEVDVHMIIQGGIIHNGGEQLLASVGDVKFNIKVSNWNFHHTSNVIDVSMILQGNGGESFAKKVNPGGGVRFRRQATGGDSYGSSDGGIGLVLSKKCMLDGNWEDMEDGYPTGVMTGNKLTLTFRFPNFTNYAYYDPTVSMQTPTTGSGGLATTMTPGVSQTGNQASSTMQSQTGSQGTTMQSQSTTQGGGTTSLPPYTGTWIPTGNSGSSTATTSEPPSHCVDTESNCLLYRSLGKCDNPGDRKAMLQFCQRTCRLCGSTKTTRPFISFTVPPLSGTTTTSTTAKTVSTTTSTTKETTTMNATTTTNTMAVLPPMDDEDKLGARTSGPMLLATKSLVFAAVFILKMTVMMT